jgi:L-alanine-DL-glutamate epimerase-like enolase superfamily enzyme
MATISQVPRPASRRKFLRDFLLAGSVAALAPRAWSALPTARITRVRIYRPPNHNPLFNQSNMVVTVETDAGLTGIGEGGSKDTLEQCAERLIGRNPFDIERCWQDMYRAFFYPPGREKTHALGALDLALWDIKGKALDVPVYDLLGGMNRNHVECYLTGGTRGLSLKEAARAAIEAGYRAYRITAASPDGSTTFQSHEAVRQFAREAKEVRDGVGPKGDWIVDFHQRFDFADAVRACRLCEEFEPYFVEDPVRMEAFLEDIPKLRKLTTVPLTAGEQWGVRWEFNKLVENHDIDYIRATLPNVGGITEMVKIAALCETHSVGIVPHFTGPIATASLVHAIGPFSGPVLMEWVSSMAQPPYLPEWLDFRHGKLWPVKRPGLGVTLDLKPLTLVGEVTKPGADRVIYFRPDGSQTNW